MRFIRTMRFISTKRLMRLIIFALLAVSLTACGGDSGGGTDNKTAKTTWGSMTYGTDCWKDPCQ